MATSDHQLGVGSRLQEPPSTALVQSFAQEMAYAAYLYEGLSWADLAHVTMLLETGIAPAEPAKRLLEALVALHDGGLASLRLEAKWGDLYNNRDAELGRRLGADAGWLHAGRARREALTIGWLLHLRRAGAELLEKTAAVLDSWAAVAERHAETLMPDFTYLQHAHPTTLGHYLLGFAYPVARDAERLDAALRQADASPAGSASTNGSRLPLDRERMRELLGFGGIAVHDRDAMWQSDVPISLMAVLVSLAGHQLGEIAAGLAALFPLLGDLFEGGLDHGRAAHGLVELAGQIEARNLAVLHLVDVGLDLLGHVLPHHLLDHFLRLIKLEHTSPPPRPGGRRLSDLPS